jgi:hypothetical protein
MEKVANWKKDFVIESTEIEDQIFLYMDIHTQTHTQKMSDLLCSLGD